jgi:type IV fimbrial biogenesis protein FimT
MERQLGQTLTELVFTLAIVAGLLGWGVPNFRELNHDTARNRELNQFLQSVYLARGEAIKRNRVISLCPSRDGERCAPPGTRWQDGWIVFVNEDRDAPAVRDPGEALLRAYAAWPGGAILGNRSTLSFRGFGQSGVTSTFVFCDARGPRAARAVIVSQTGRPRVSDRNASNGRLACT